MLRLYYTVFLLVVSQLALACVSGYAQSRNVALNAKVSLLPLPNNLKNAADAASRAAALVDGKKSSARESFLWEDPLVPVWKYDGRINIGIDLDGLYDLSSISINLLGGSDPRGSGQAKGFPSLVEVLVSLDGENYFKVGSFSRWNEDDVSRFAVPAEDGKAWTHRLQFEDLNVPARFVGIRIVSSGLTATDEITVIGTERAENVVAEIAGDPEGFSVKHAELYFHRQELLVAENATLPIPMGARSALGGAESRDITLSLELPKGITLEGGHFGFKTLSSPVPEELPDGGSRYTLKYSLKANNPMWNRHAFARLFFLAKDYEGDEKNVIRYQFGNDEDWSSPWLEIPFRVVSVTPAQQPEKLMTGLGWWYPDHSLQWPDMISSLKTIGLNTFPYTIGASTPSSAHSAEVTQLRQAQAEGFKVALVDNTIFRMLARHRDKPEMFSEFSDGSRGRAVSPVYRGKYWQEEVERFANLVDVIRPDFLCQDIEIWPSYARREFDFRKQHSAPKVADSGDELVDDSKQLQSLNNGLDIHSQADFIASGLSPTQWERSKGLEMWRELLEAARAKVEANGGSLDGLSNGGYNFRPGHTYQNLFNFNQLEEEGLIVHSQPSYYSNYYPNQIAWLGDLVRRDRNAFQRGKAVMPWISPGDAGAYPAEIFQALTLEAYANGAEGIWFWSNRMWDATTLVAYNEVIRAITHFEDVIVDGDYIGDNVKLGGKGRLSGMQKDGRMLLLLADYTDENSGAPLALNLELSAPSKVIDLFTGETLTDALPAGSHELSIDLNGKMFRLLGVEPVLSR